MALTSKFVCMTIMEEELLTPPSTPPKKSALIGDRSAPCVLPLVQGRHADLHNISPMTVAELVQGHYKDVVATFTIVDCRYPYEFDGGHIAGAINLYKESMVEEYFFDPSRVSQRSSCGRNVIVFHCEFSQQRGPTMLRHLRQMDRERNLHQFPSLDYPEIYILDGGYENFFNHFAVMCNPCGYIQMNDPRFEDDLDRHFVSKKYSNKNKIQRRVFGSIKSRTLTF